MFNFWRNAGAAVSTAAVLNSTNIHKESIAMTVDHQDIIIPSSPADRDDIFRVIKSMSDSKTRAKAESDYQKEAKAELAKKYNIPVKHIGKMLNDYHKQTFDKNVQESEQYQALYESVFGSSAEGTASVDEEE